jgi:DNA topoisomerase VI subunit A
MSLTDNLLKRLDFLELEQDRQQEEVMSLAEEISPEIGLKMENINVKKSTKGYVILLEFADAPVSEWSDETNGWRSKNLGSRYTSIQQADKKLAILKQKWPEYPLRIGLIT